MRFVVSKFRKVFPETSTTSEWFRIQRIPKRIHGETESVTQLILNTREAPQQSPGYQA